MSEFENPTNASPEPELTIRFRQVLIHQCEDGEWWFGVSLDGGIYQREYSHGAEETIWRRVAALSSTQLDMRPCTYSGCDTLFESLPGSPTDAKSSLCPYHRRYGA